MKLRSLLFAASGVLLSACAAWAQPATTLQLPEFHYTTVNTTVSVPDGGTVLLGGIKRASEQRIENGVPVLGKVPGLGRLFNNNAIGKTTSAGNMSVTARIIILEEEEAKLGLAPPTSRAGGPAVNGPAFAEPNAVDQKADFLSRNVGRRDAPQVAAPVQPAGPSRAEIRARNEQLAETRQREAYELYEKARTAASSGKLKVAKIYLDQAARRATGDLKSHVAAQLTVVQNAMVSAANPLSQQRDN